MPRCVQALLILSASLPFTARKQRARAQTTMASSLFTSTLTHTSNSPFCSKNHSKIPSLPFLSFTHSLKLFPSSSKSLFLQRKQSSENGVSTVKVQNFDFSDSLFEGGFGSGDDPISSPGSGIAAVEDKEEIPCPPGLRQYETMAVLRPEMNEEERLALTQKYEEVMIVLTFLTLLVQAP